MKRKKIQRIDVPTVGYEIEVSILSSFFEKFDAHFKKSIESGQLRYSCVGIVIEKDQVVAHVYEFRYRKAEYRQKVIDYMMKSHRF